MGIHRGETREKNSKSSGHGVNSLEASDTRNGTATVRERLSLETTRMPKSVEHFTGPT
jgi:hypothetical protein